LDVDNTFAFQSWTVGLLELLPDPRVDRYRFTAQVRHEQSDLGGEVGLYFARKTYPGKASEIFYYTTLVFNGVRGYEDFKRLIPAELFSARPHDNAVQVWSHLYSDEAIRPNVDRGAGVASGSRFKPNGGGINAIWHDLEVIVTPEKVTLSWDGQPFAV